MARSTQLKRPVATRFTCLAPEGRAVFLAGTFNGWDPNATPMTKNADGNWDVSVTVAPGRYEFKFVVDGTWHCEPGCDDTNRGCPECVPNSFGTMNRVIGVEASP